MDQVKKLFAILKKKAQEHPTRIRGMRERLDALTLRQCKDCDRDHAESERQFAHAGHVSPSTVCYAKAMNELSLPFLLGILVHEIGHVAAGTSTRHSEDAANEFGQYVTGIKVYWRPCEFLRDKPGVLEWSRVPAWVSRAMT